MLSAPAKAHRPWIPLWEFVMGPEKKKTRDMGLPLKRGPQISSLACTAIFFLSRLEKLLRTQTCWVQMLLWRCFFSCHPLGDLLTCRVALPKSTTLQRQPPAVTEWSNHLAQIWRILRATLSSKSPHLSAEAVRPLSKHLLILFLTICLYRCQWQDTL